MGKAALGGSAFHKDRQLDRSEEQAAEADGLACASWRRAVKLQADAAGVVDGV